ncbi:MAG: transcriptional repressor [Ignavibacteriales bacterium]|nr:transcriptional repressor [Ignavibacteriales bacterium]
MEQHGTKRSRQREKIFQVLKRTTSHPTAEWVYERVREQIPRISLGTVYRNLHILKEQL